VSGGSAGASDTVLTAVIVDDTPDIRMLTRLALEMDGGVRVVGEAENGRDGIDVVQRHQPDVVVLDMAMPVMDGLEALPHIKRACPTARVLVVSGFDDATVARSAAEVGADDFLQKGAPPAVLLERVHALAARPRPDLQPEPQPDPESSDGSS
jgi:DNA-binding NarL/FixJ family response regulator